MYQRILVTTDGTTLSKKAITHAAQLASLCGAELVGLNVVGRYPLSYFEGGVAMSPNEITRIEGQWVQNGRDALEAVTKAAADKDVKSKVVVVKSDLVAESIIAAARKHKCDLVVMASHGRKGIKRLLLGSETQHVLTHSHIPVLVLR